MEKLNELPQAFYGVIQGGKVVMLPAEDGQWLNKTSVAEAFRALEKRAEAAEAERSALQDGFSEAIRHKDRLADELNELAKQEPVAWRYRTTNIYGEPNQGWTFSDSDSLMGLYQPLYAHPAPAADLTELVPNRIPVPELGESLDSTSHWCDGWNSCRAAILCNIEEAK